VSSILFLSDSVALLFKDVQLFTQIGQFLIEIKFSLVVEYLVSLLTTLYVQQHFLFSDSKLKQRFFILELLLQGGGLGLRL
jgi:hypothetical protein